MFLIVWGFENRPLALALALAWFKENVVSRD